MPTIRMNREQMQGGYTVLPNQILRTREMSYKARYLLAQMLSMSEAWQYTVAGNGQGLRHGARCRPHRHGGAGDLGLLSAQPEPCQRRFSHNVYIIREVPVEVEAAPAEADVKALSETVSAVAETCAAADISMAPCGQDSVPMPAAFAALSNTQESVVQEAFSAPLADSPLPVSTLPENLPLRKNKGKKYQEKKYQDSLPSPSPIHPIYPSSREKFVGILEWNSCLAKYKRQVEYDTLLFDHPEWKERLDELLELMTEAAAVLRPPSALADVRSPPRWCGRGMPRSICSSSTTFSTSSAPPSNPFATSGSICGRYSFTHRPPVPTTTTPAFAGISTGKTT